MRGLLLGLLWLASFVGQMWFWTDLRKLPAAFAPLMTIASLTMVMYAGGMLGVLQSAAWLMVSIGFALFCWMICRKSGALLKAELLIFALGVFALWLRYRAALLVAYDDFSHWGMIVRQMLVHNRLPGAEDALITFQSYPPAAACWLYYACGFLGKSDGMMLVAQAAFVLAGWLPLFSFARGKNWPLKAACVMIAVLVGLSLFQGTASLMVDNLLSALAVGALCLAVQKCFSPWHIGMLAAVLSLVKDSGLFFAGVLIVFCAVLIFRQSQKKTRIKQLVQLCLPAIAVRGVWLGHITWAFPAATVSRHALTVENLRATGADKSYADMLSIGKKLLMQTISLQNQAIQILGLMLLAAIVIVVARRIQTGKWRVGSEMAVPGISAAVYVVWMGFLWLMYVFSMTLSNAQQLVAFERYNSTIALFFYGGMVLWILCTSARQSKAAAICMLLIALLPVSIGAWSSGITRLIKENYFVPLRVQMEELAKNELPDVDQKAVIVVSEADDSVYADYMARYVFQNPEIEAVSETDTPQAQVYYIACENVPPLPQGVRVVRLTD